MSHYPTVQPVVGLPPITFEGEVISGDLYQALGVEPSESLTQATIRQAYLKQCAKFHPDKHPQSLKDAATAAFSRISLAFKTLSDPALRYNYDQNGIALHTRSAARTSLASGNTVYNALELAKRYSDMLPVLHELPAIETANGLPLGSLKASSGRESTCSGVDCELSFLHTLTHIKHKILLCKRHHLIHQCDHECTQPNRVCPLWAAWHINKYRHEVATSWCIQVSDDKDPNPKSPYWYNTRAGISMWKTNDDESDMPPTLPVTPHTCTSTKCKDSGFLQLDAGIWVCRASSTGHICTSSQCTWQWRPPAVKCEPVEAVPKERIGKSELVCWATMRPCMDSGEKWGDSRTDRPLAGGGHGLENRVVTFNDERTGMRVKSMIQRPFGTTEGEAVENVAGALQSDMKTIQQLNLEQTMAESAAREAERRRLEKLRQNHDAFNDDSDAIRLGKRQRSHVKSPGDGLVSRLKRLRSNIQQRRNGLYNSDIAATSDDDEGLDEGASLYNTYNILDAADYDQNEEIGDYQTQYTAAGGVEAILEEYEELGEHEEQARQEYLEYAQQQFLEAQTPNTPVDWYGDPRIGEAHPNGGAMRIYDGRILIVRQRPPMFIPPQKENFAASQKMQMNRKKLTPRVRGVDPRTRARLRKFAHKLSPHGSTSPSVISRETSPTPSGADRMDIGRLRSLSPDLP